MAKTREESLKELNSELGQEVDIEKDNEKWRAQDLQTKSSPIIDPGVGKPYIIRQFEFKKNPEFKGTLTKQEVFNLHWRQIRMVLWGDGLVPYEDVPPKIVFEKNGTYRIFIVAKARFGVSVIDKPISLNEALKKKKRP